MTPSERAAKEARTASTVARMAKEQRDALDASKKADAEAHKKDKDAQERESARLLIAYSPLGEWFPGVEWWVEDTWTSTYYDGLEARDKRVRAMGDDDPRYPALTLVLRPTGEHGKVDVYWPIWQNSTDINTNGYYFLQRCPTLAEVGRHVENQRAGYHAHAVSEQQQIREGLQNAKASLKRSTEALDRHVAIWGDLSIDATLTSPRSES